MGARIAHKEKAGDGSQGMGDNDKEPEDEVTQPETPEEEAQVPNTVLSRCGETGDERRVAPQ